MQREALQLTAEQRGDSIEQAIRNAHCRSREARENVHRFLDTVEDTEFPVPMKTVQPNVCCIVPRRLFHGVVVPSGVGAVMAKCVGNALSHKLSLL